MSIYSIRADILRWKEREFRREERDRLEGDREGFVRGGSDKKVLNIEWPILQLTLLPVIAVSASSTKYLAKVCD